MDIYIAHDGQESGPFSDNAARELLAQGAVKENDFAWRTGMEKWVPLSELLAETKSEPPVAGSTPPPPSEGKFEPATPKQKALLSFLGITFAADLSRDQAARRVNDAMEDSSNTERLKLWNEERLRLHPELFAAEIQAKKENRANHFLELCQTRGARYFSGISKAHCQVLVGFLDVKFPNWDAREGEAAENYFFPAVAEKFPQLVHKQWRGRLRYAEGMKVAPELVSTSLATQVRVTATSPLVAVARGIALGLVILAVLYLGYRTMRSDVTAAPTTSGGRPEPVVAAATPEPAPTMASATAVPEKLPAIDEIPAPVAPVAATETAALPTTVPPLPEIPPVATAPAFPIPPAPAVAAVPDSTMAPPPPPPAAMLPGIPAVPGLPPSLPADPTVASVPTVPGLPPSPPADPATPGMPAVPGLPPSPPADPAPPIAMLPPSPPPPATLPGMAPTAGVPDPTMPVPPSAITSAPVATLPGMEPPVPVAPPPATLPVAGTLPSTPMPADPAVPGLPPSPPTVPSVPGLPPSPSTDVPPGLPPSVPGTTKTNLVLTKAVEVQLTYGKISLRPGTQVKLISRQGQTAKVSYGGNIINVPVSSTDLE